MENLIESVFRRNLIRTLCSSENIWETSQDFRPLIENSPSLDEQIIAPEIPEQILQILLHSETADSPDVHLQ